MSLAEQNASRAAPPEARVWRDHAKGACTLCAFWFAALCLSGFAATDPTLEYKVKAGYLYNFAKFIEWPPATLPNASSPIEIGVMDGGEAFSTIEQVLTGKTVNGHPIHVTAVASLKENLNCHILLATRAARTTPSKLRSALDARPILLVGETEKFSERGGMIGFIREEESIRLTLNLEAATAAGLKVSAKLANVARVVKTERIQ